MYTSKIYVLCLILFRLNQPVSFNLTPSEPVYYYYNFEQNTSMVLLHVTSDDNICMTLSIQNSSVKT